MGKSWARYAVASKIIPMINIRLIYFGSRDDPYGDPNDASIGLVPEFARRMYLPALNKGCSTRH
ncbi:uncharacterized protein FOMMEDRAFT_138023 [Fomitiporia mediterranea MF3/22]|uniref:uncharacterized protein n=1 Tax=Fomitiporia mediterranea (strain MF3/22) TaxID=694068 RepID=UPI0004407975|nr:uncharacterized protein FOMMEDRAFT_138023 [Fomitiporia mediterranea MF3/22]EJD07913.1 hypothetical protein FOMMEDRAFT_138023 [Fomitiporia mediterranea MF3/22]